ncbi:hypothetical protein OZX62_04520 [Bifidobacterium sp. ESL0690]|uniref:hypothetical protein n=1 Tax=Bifidobacterium sp. ESL0690 TaxID=2983214 RepID=UPI0023F828FA|nr:hypothetical protein [Bifidobacterium sp. ESL0690]WEV47538.1 hypothetical protein OZX62_04520 [Bifidobacterium sp. ESL0690]
MLHLHKHNKEWTPRELSRLLSSKNKHYPISDAYEHEFLSGPHWWDSQRTHVTRWLNEYNSSGAYHRKNHNLDAKSFWNHFLCAPGLLWVAEALGEDSEIVQSAANMASSKSNVSSQCAAIRKIIPWERILELIHEQ